MRQDRVGRRHSLESALPRAWSLVTVAILVAVGLGVPEAAPATDGAWLCPPVEPASARPRSVACRGAKAPRNARRAAEVGAIDAVRIRKGPAGELLADLPVHAAPRLLRRPGLLILTPTSVRSVDYQLLVQVEDGSLVPAKPGNEATYRGRVSGVPGSVVAAALHDDGLFARVEIPGQGESWIEPAPAGLAAAGTGRHIVYRGEDLTAGDEAFTEGDGTRDDVPDTPSLETALLEETAGRSPVEAAEGSFAGSGLAVAEIAIDVDNEYFRRHGSVSAVEDRVHAVINAVNIQYERDVGIRHVISTIIVRASEPDPYSSTSPDGLMDQLRTQWVDHHAAVKRDFTHLFTGKDVDSSVIGYAYVSAVCTSYGYGIVQSDFSSNFASVTDLSAHEMGHNWGADHCACSNPPYTMNPYVTSSNRFHPLEDIPEIVAFRNSRTCLDSLEAALPPAAPTGLDATVVSSSEVELEWVDASSDEDGFRVERSTDGASWEIVGTTAAGAEAWLDSGLSAGTTYRWRVKSYNSGGESASDDVVATTEPAVAPFTIETLQVTIGTLLSGDVGDLSAADGADAAVFSAVEGKKLRIQVVGSATSPWATVSRLGWIVDAAALEPGVTLTVYLYSFSAEKWVRAGKRIRLEPAASAYLGEVRRPERFVDPLTREIRVMVQGKAPSGKSPDGFELRIDRLALEGLP